MIEFIEKFIPKMLKPIYEKYKMVFWYLVFGVLTTIINIVTYAICHKVLKIANIPSTIIAWVMTVAVAYLTNRKAVFDSQAIGIKEKLSEVVKFVVCRIGTQIIDIIIMYVAVDCLKWNDILWKTIANIIVVISNYIASKLIIFTSQKNNIGEKNYEN